MNKKYKIIIGIIICMVIILGVVYLFQNNKKENEIQQRLRITINVKDKENKEIYNNTIDTQKKYLSDALQEIDDLSVKMEDSEYGKYITEILGIKQDENFYWSYYINDEYASVGISNCILENNAIYSFRIEKIIY